MFSEWLIDDATRRDEVVDGSGWLWVWGGWMDAEGKKAEEERVGEIEI